MRYERNGCCAECHEAVRKGIAWIAVFVDSYLVNRGGRVLTRTTTQLLDDLRDSANEIAWVEFDRRFRPVLLGFARSLGMGSDEAAELAQRSLVAFLETYQAGGFVRGRGRLSSWLLGIARNTALSMHRGARMLPDSGQLEELPDEQSLLELWNREHDSAVLSEAITQLSATARLEAHTLRAFELFALRGVPAAEVAAECGIEVEAVYVIKNRLTKRLREIVRELTDDGSV